MKHFIYEKITLDLTKLNEETLDALYSFIKENNIDYDNEYYSVSRTDAEIYVESNLEELESRLEEQTKNLILENYKDLKTFFIGSITSIVYEDILTEIQDNIDDIVSEINWIDLI